MSVAAGTNYHLSRETFRASPAHWLPGSPQLLSGVQAFMSGDSSVYLLIIPLSEPSAFPNPSLNPSGTHGLARAPSFLVSLMTVPYILVMVWIASCQNLYAGFLTPSTWECGDRVQTEVIKFKWGHYRPNGSNRPQSNMTGVLIKRGNLETNPHTKSNNVNMKHSHLQAKEKREQMLPSHALEGTNLDDTLIFNFWSSELRQ